MYKWVLYMCLLTAYLFFFLLKYHNSFYTIYIFLLSRIARALLFAEWNAANKSSWDKVNAALLLSLTASVSLRWYHDAPCKYTQHVGLLRLDSRISLWQGLVWVRSSVVYECEAEQWEFTANPSASLLLCEHDSMFCIEYDMLDCKKSLFYQL